MGSIARWWCVLTPEDGQRIALAVRLYGPEEHLINDRTRYEHYDDVAHLVPFLDRKIVIAALCQAHRFFDPDEGFLATARKLKSKPCRDGPVP
jgi:hypothetical protein